MQCNVVYLTGFSIKWFMWRMGVSIGIICCLWVGLRQPYYGGLDCLPHGGPAVVPTHHPIQSSHCANKEPAEPGLSLGLVPRRCI